MKHTLVNIKGTLKDDFMSKIYLGIFSNLII